MGFLMYWLINVWYQLRKRVFTSFRTAHIGFLCLVALLFVADQNHFAGALLCLTIADMLDD